MTKISYSLLAIGLMSSALTALPVNTSAQTTETLQSEQAPFASENAILDTAIPFAIGSREAQQSLRGSFGWPTFQEGLVQGVYFRFDPDGYARFAPTPRLDSDVFEVICRPRTLSCMGRKGSLALILNSRGQLQLKIDDVQQGDRFFVSEGVTEIEVPERVLQPLDTQLELLLSAGGDLIVRRGENQKDRISLTGFYAVSAYLRWVAAQQDYTILPRGWPIPNAASSETGVTQAVSWQSPMPQPQNFPTGQQGLAEPQQNVTVAPANQVQTQPQPAETPMASNEVDQVKNELKILRELLMIRDSKQQGAIGTINTRTTIESSAAQSAPSTAPQDEVANQIAELQKAAQQIQADLARISQTPGQTPATLENVVLAPPLQTVETTPHQVSEVMDGTKPSSKIVKRLEYLMSEIGLDAKTALMLIQLGESQEPMNNAITPTSASIQSLGPLETNITNSNTQETAVARILKELEGDLNKSLQVAEADESPTAQEGVSTQDYQILSQYFTAVFPKNER